MMDDETTLGEARDWLRERAPKGEKCPCCRQYVRVYRRKLNSGMARWLIRFHLQTWASKNWHHATHITERAMGEEYSKLAHWKLLEHHPERVGYWRLTDLGTRFALNEQRVQSHAVIYDNRCIRLDGDPVSIVTALGRKFNYNELMAERPGSREPQ